ncbi:helix-turn-helix domain-containing protein [Xanthomonas arboricola]|uniref:helix-turn-helix domain-containing protein n=1 Tax=Xanthomonas arboricola TaxID=56448 RepID=UPI0040407FCB
MKPETVPGRDATVSFYRRLGFSPMEAKRLSVASHRQANDTTALKEQLMSEISGWIDQHCLKQAEAAEILKVSRPRVSDVVNKKASKFTMDALVDMLSRVGKPVTLSVGTGVSDTNNSVSLPS